MFDDGLLIVGQICICIVWSLLPGTFLKSDLQRDYSFPSAMVLMGTLALFYVIPHNLIKTYGYKYSLFVKLISMVGITTLCIFRNGVETNTNPYYVFASVVNWDIIYLSQGMIDMIYYKEQKQIMVELKDTMAAPITFITFFWMYSICTPISRTG